MGLKQIATSTVTSAVASVTLTGIDDDSVYMVSFNNVLGTSEPTNFSFRFTESGSANSTSNYDYAFWDVFAASSFAGRYGSNQNRTPFNQGSGSTALETQQGILYIYNANDSSDETVLTKGFKKTNDNKNIFKYFCIKVTSVYASLKQWKQPFHRQPLLIYPLLPPSVDLLQPFLFLLQNLLFPLKY